MSKNPTPSSFDFQQIFQRAFDDSNDRLRVDSVASIEAGQMEVAIDKDEDSITAYQGGTWNFAISGGATETKQDTGNLSLSAINLKIDTLAIASKQDTIIDTLTNGTQVVKINDGGGSITVDGVFYQAIQPVSIATMPVTPITDNSGSLTVDGSVAATQSGTWNISNISGTITLPTGASTSANQASELIKLDTGNASLASIDGKLNTTLNGVKVDGSGITQPVSGSVSVSNFPSVQPISDNAGSITVDGAVSISNFPVTQPISGTVTANIGTSGSLALDATLTGGSQRSKITDGTNNAAVKAASTSAGATDPALVVAVSPNNSVAVTGTFWQATQPISGSITAITNVVHVDDNNSTISIDDGAGSITVDGSVSVLNFPATQPISGTITANAGTGSFTVAQATASNLNATVTGTVAATQSGTWNINAITTLPALTVAGAASSSPIGSVSIGNSLGKTNVLKTGLLTSTAATVDQVILTYTVTVGKTFYLIYATMDVKLTAVSATGALLGEASLETPSGTKVITTTFNNPTIELPDRYRITFPEPIPISAGAVIRWVCTPAGTTSTKWYGNFGGYEK